MPSAPVVSHPTSASVSGAGGGGGGSQGHKGSESPKETVISIIIAFAMAFVFRGFVVEAFVIPTGSMAPTLLGQHMRFYEPATGNDWAVGPWQSRTPGQADYLGEQREVRVHDPMSGIEQFAPKARLRSGDRILVLKYLYGVSSPQRFDVIVFKDPHDTHMQSPGRPADNYIKRLLGLPGEEIALVDGDVFVRRASASDPPFDPLTYWSLPGWSIARKPAVVQRSVWQPVYDSAMAPLPAPMGFQRPWRGSDAGWTFDRERVYEWKPQGGDGATTLTFDQNALRFVDRSTRREERWAINDRYAYNESPHSGKDPFQQIRFPVSDVRVRAGVEPVGEAPRSGDGPVGLKVSAVIEVHRHEFRAEVEGSTARLRVRKPVGEAGVMVWETLGEAEIAPMAAGRVTNVEFWHADQALRLYVDDRLVIGPVAMDWSIAERLRFATGETVESIAARQRQGSSQSVFDDPLLYKHSRAQVRWELGASPGGVTGSGVGAVRLHRVAVDRDLFYRPESEVAYQRGLPGLATSPYSPVRLNGDQFFCCGDNSPQSLDGRLWGAPDPWVARDFGPDFGVVPRQLLLGKAFFVYWPSLVRDRGKFPVPDFGRMRFIW